MSHYTIYITPTVSNDLAGAVEYYNLQAEDLGYRFADLVETYLTRIALMPTTSAVRYHNIRCKPMATFPYLIMFTIDEPGPPFISSGSSTPASSLSGKNFHCIKHFKTCGTDRSLFGRHATVSDREG